MKIYSEKTRKEYPNVEECLAAEALFDKEQAEKIEKQKELQKVKKDRADEVVAAYEQIKKAEREYVRLRNEFVKDYGSFHMSYRDSEEQSLPDIFSDLFKILDGMGL